ILVPPGDTTAIRRELEQLIDSDALAADYGRRARERAGTHFDWAHIGDQYLDLFKQVIGQSEERAS
ncbi:MAG: hypothetical protein GY851_16215, partial [bacterium]|nr:hypothetical protein [bacterium]